MNIDYDEEDYGNEEDYCPLCIEEMDISDKKFFPCPCLYQICQFCYNNIRQNPELNGRCPACRRKYDDESVRYVELTPDEIKAENARKAGREKSKKQKEKERKEHEMASRKHLAGVRVIQKNLVYIVGLNPTVSPDDLQSLLRSDRYFGQFGRIMKVVVNKRNQNANSVGNSGYGIYITFSRKEDADKCIREVDGSIMDGKVIRAAYGTTKYCSSYLRGMSCPNPNCMFLHEPGEEADSYRHETIHHQEPTRHNEGGIIRYSMNASGRTPTNGFTNGIEHQELKPALPATASWAKNNGSSTNIAGDLNKTKNPVLASAFPTLAELALQRSNSSSSLSHMNHKEKRKERNKDNSLKDKLKENFDDLVLNEMNSSQFMADTLTSLKSHSSNEINYEFKSGLFHSIFNQDPDDFPPLFAFAPPDHLEVPRQSEEIDFLATSAELVDSILRRANADEYFLNSRSSVISNEASTPGQQPAKIQQPGNVTPGSFHAPPGLSLQSQATTNNSHSSEILNHLLNGKKSSV
ncbi:CCR4-NOT core ubiquitin-protein ligase subunit [Saccharomycopsis crataegensis]|uniref:CCR4-NOT core ubiquitin-protein ligase subunit n=1 Tax=Saccharomycopsis crataegensis TaxID=43959 RepID=A0AAV5QUU0_9ASCO|nr:CCR4-NOT core ubiquitin-protein ligase subunit [Saccharomycopsis crataegensis]